MARTKRITKRQLKEDQFVTTAFHAADYFQEHRTTILLAAAGAVALIVAGAMFVRFQASSSAQADALYGQGSQLMQVGNYPEAAFRLSSFLDAHPGHKKAATAAILVGDAYLYSGRNAEANDSYKKALEKADEGSATWFSAKAGLASIMEIDGNKAGAGEAFLELAEKAGPDRKDHYTYAAVRCFRTGGDIGRAAELMKSVDESKLDPIDLATLDWQKAELKMGTAR